MSSATRGNFSFFKTSSSTNGHKCSGDGRDGGKDGIDGNKDGKDGGSDKSCLLIPSFQFFLFQVIE
jgi:hypothetical protein